MSTLEKCLRALRALDPEFYIDLKLTHDGKFQIGGVNESDHEVIYEVEDEDSPEEAIENLWVSLKEQIELRRVRDVLSIVDEEKNNAQ